jgi:hypothetical protein
MNYFGNFSANSIERQNVESLLISIVVFYILRLYFNINHRNIDHLDFVHSLLVTFAESHCSLSVGYIR